MTDDLSDESREKQISQVALKDYKAKCGSDVKVFMIKDQLKVGGKTINLQFSINKLYFAPQQCEMKFADDH